MSKSAYGIPLNIGLVHGFLKDNSYSLLANILPNRFTLEYGNPITFKNKEELNTFTGENFRQLYAGMGAYITDIDPNTRGKQSNSYIWDTTQWRSVGDPVISEYLNIYAVEETTDEDGLTNHKLDFFMRTHIRNIQSNISLLTILNRSYSVFNNEIIAFCGINGKYNLYTSKPNNVFNSLLSVNIESGINTLMRYLCDMYEVPLIRFTQLSDSIFNSIDKIIADTLVTFKTFMQDNLNTDISMYINYISSCFAAFKFILQSKYNDNAITIESIEPNECLAIIDKTLLNKLEISSSSRLSFLEILQAIDNILYRDGADSRYNFFKELELLIDYFKANTKDPTLFSNNANRNDLFENICEGIGGIVNLALMFSLLSSAYGNAKSSMYLHFICKDKFQDLK